MRIVYQMWTEQRLYYRQIYLNTKTRRFEKTRIDGGPQICYSGELGSEEGGNANSSLQSLQKGQGFRDRCYEECVLARQGGVTK